MKIYSFTRPELDYFELECNFTSDELKLFRLRAKAMPLEDCAEEMNVSVSTVWCGIKKVDSLFSRIS